MKNDLHLVPHISSGLPAVVSQRSGDFVSARGASGHASDGCRVLDTNCWIVNIYYGKEFVFEDACLTLFGTRSM